MDFMRMFSLKSRSTFFLLVAALCIFSVGAWWSVRLLVWSELEGRLHSNADRIEASLRERLMTHGNNLVHIRAYFLLHGVPDKAGFRQLVSQIELLTRYPGVRGVGFAKVVRSNDRAQFNEEMSRMVPGFRMLQNRANNFNLPVTMVEPLDWQNQRSLGVDMLAEARTREAVSLALQTGEVALSNPMQLGSESEPSRDGFLLFLPVFRESIGAASNEAESESNRQLEGIIFSPFRTSDFFEAAFGTPTLKNETVNFEVSSLETGSQGNVLYNRFGVTDQDVQPWTKMERRISIFGQQLFLQVYPLQHFYSFADRYLALIVGLGAALVSCMVMVVMRVSQNHLLIRKGYHRCVALRECRPEEPYETGLLGRVAD